MRVFSRPLFSGRGNKIFAAAVGLIFLISLNFFQKDVKSFFYSVSYPIQQFLWGQGLKASNFLETIAEIKDLKSENEKLKLKIQELVSENNSLKELGSENEVLRGALAIELPKDFQLTFAEVVGKDIGQDSILINRGYKQGVAKDMPVITQQKVLVGKIGDVYKDFSKVILISNSNKENSFDAKIADSDVFGRVRGEGNLGVVLDLIPRDKEIKEGQFAVTASLGNNYPKNLLVGSIKKVVKNDIEPFQEAEISPFFDIQKLESVFIIADRNFQN